MWATKIPMKRRSPPAATARWRSASSRPSTRCAVSPRIAARIDTLLQTLLDFRRGASGPTQERDSTEKPSEIQPWTDTCPEARPLGSTCGQRSSSRLDPRHTERPAGWSASWWAPSLPPAFPRWLPDRRSALATLLARTLRYTTRLVVSVDRHLGRSRLLAPDARGQSARGAARISGRVRLGDVRRSGGCGTARSGIRTAGRTGAAGQQPDAQWPGPSSRSSGCSWC